MVVRLEVTDAAGNVRQAELSAGDTLHVGVDEQVALTDVAFGRAHGQITDTDLVALTVDGETMFLRGLSEHLESENGVSLAFADGETVDTLGALLRWLEAGSAPQGAAGTQTALAMGDLVSNEADIGDVVYLDLDLAAELPGASTGAATLSLDDVLQAPAESVLLDEGLAGAGGEASGLWADTEFALGGSVAGSLFDEDGFTDIIPPDVSGLV